MSKNNNCTWSRNRTGTGITAQEILSLSCLPVSTLRCAVRGGIEPPRSNSIKDICARALWSTLIFYLFHNLRPRDEWVCLPSLGVPPPHSIKRRLRDSNPRYAFTYDGFQDRCIQPLCQISVQLFYVSR